jgi:hypothetical protein
MPTDINNNLLTIDLTKREYVVYIAAYMRNVVFFFFFRLNLFLYLCIKLKTEYSVCLILIIFVTYYFI